MDQKERDNLLRDLQNKSKSHGTALNTLQLTVQNQDKRIVSANRSNSAVGSRLSRVAKRVNALDITESERYLDAIAERVESMASNYQVTVCQMMITSELRVWLTQSGNPDALAILSSCVRAWDYLPGEWWKSHGHTTLEQHAEFFKELSFITDATTDLESQL